MSKENFYKNTSAYGRDPELNSNTLDHLKTMISLMGKNEKVLDVGCATGLQTKYMGEKTGSRMYGIDLGVDNVKIAKSHGIDAKLSDAEKNFPFPGNSFDTVVASGLIEHLFDHHTFIEEVRRVLRPRGRVVIMTNNMAYWPNRLLLLFGKTTIDVQPHRGMQENQHIRYFTKKTIKALFESHGFIIEKLFTRYPQVPFLCRFSRRLGNPYINAGGLGFQIYLKARKK